MFLRLYFFVLKRIKSSEEYDNTLYRVVNRWANHILKVIGVNVRIKGIENLPKGNCLIVSNHQSDVDPLILIAKLNKQMGFIAKKEMLKLYVVGTWMKAINCVFIDREDIRESLKAINKGIDNLEKGYSMVIFPEGTRSRSNKLGEFKKGSMKMATKASVPLVPIVLDNVFKAFEEGNGKFRATDVNMSILEPINVSELSKEEKANLAEMVRERIQKELNTLNNNNN
jgi:1-acyl-sn-glycerol-3-phosphate acyltransferase